MLKPVQPVSRRYSFLVFLGMFCTVVIALVTALCFASPLSGIPFVPVKSLDLGWIDENGNTVGRLPCSLPVTGNTLRLSHDFSRVSPDEDDVLVFQTRYATVRIWADETLIYESAQGESHATGSRWHFVPVSSCKGAAKLVVEFTRYDTEENWEVYSVLMDHPEAIRTWILRRHFPALLFWAFSVLFIVVLIIVSIFMAYEKIPGISVVLSLAAFVFLSGQWILLDTKITILMGGNYALTYFFSYAAFYLLPVPFLLYIQLMLDSRNRILRWLPWLFIGNTVFCMGLRFLGVTALQNTVVITHGLIFVAIAISSRELFQHFWKGEEKRIFFTFFGILFIYAAGLVSIILYYTGQLPPTNYSMLFSWALLLLILAMTLDGLFALGRFWKQKQRIEHYRQLAVQDSMTLMGNRNAFELQLQKLVKDPPSTLVFLLFDVDNLKTINDTYGHHVGDQVIYISSQCIHEVFGSSGSCYRIGGDEYCMILTSSRNIETKLRRFDALFDSRSRDIVPTTVSHGWAVKHFAPGQKTDREEILALQKEADRNLYCCKNERKQQKSDA